MSRMEGEGLLDFGTRREDDMSEGDYKGEEVG